MTLAPFDGIADTYDQEFARRPVGAALRRMVWERLDAAWCPGMRVLDVGCGTGEDACHLAGRGVEVVGLDASAAMVAAARQKAIAAGLDTLATFAVLPLEALANVGSSEAFDSVPGLDRPFDGVLANFGVLNCVRPGTRLADCFGSWIRPGSRLLTVVMGPTCAWEMGWYAGHRDPYRALRRWEVGGTVARLGASKLLVRYPTPAQLARTLAPEFRLTHLQAIGCILPPNYAARWLESRPRLLRRLVELERRTCTMSWAVALADHYLAEWIRQAP